MALTHPWLPGVLLHLLMTMTILTMTTLTATAPQAMHLLRLPRPRAARLLDDDVLHALLAHRRPHKARAHRAAACLRGDPQQAAGDTTIASIVMASHSRRKGRAHDPIIPSSHHPIILPSHHPIIPSSHHPIIPSSHHPTIPSSHHPTIPSSHVQDTIEAVLIIPFSSAARNATSTLLLFKLLGIYQVPPHRVAASITYGCSPHRIGLQPPSHRVAACPSSSCSASRRPTSPRSSCSW